MEKSATLKSGICPRCDSREIYTYDGRRGDRSILPISAWGRFYLQTYICIKCGHFEELIRNEDLGMKEIEDVIKREKNGWKKVA